MSLYTQVIGQRMPHGFAGSYSRQPDSVIDTHALVTTPVQFGLGVTFSATGKSTVTLPTSTTTAAQFVGVAAREVKSATNYLSQGTGVYNPGDAVPVFKRGCVNVLCQRGTPAPGGAVYLRVAANDTYPNAVVGGFEAEADSTNTVQLTNCQWKGQADTNGIAELRIMTIINA